MVNLWCMLIINKRRTYEQVPDLIKEEVFSHLNEMGYDANGDKL